MQGVPLQIPEKVRRRAELLGEAGHVWRLTRLGILPRSNAAGQSRSVSHSTTALKPLSRKHAPTMGKMSS